ncbi:MAG: hypothetical protein ACOCXP_04045 [Candidatus Dojkabacteria bacterium]
MKLINWAIYSWSYLVLVTWWLSAIGELHWWVYRWFVYALVFMSLALAVRERNYFLEVLTLAQQRLVALSRLDKLFITSALSVWIFFTGYVLVSIFVNPPFNWDSMTYHLPKIAMASQEGTLWHQEDATVDRINFSPSNSNILTLAAFSVFGHDFLVELPQAVASLAIPLLFIWLGKYAFKQRVKNLVPASVVLLTTNLYWNQAISTQNDLVFVFVSLLGLVVLIDFANDPKFRKIITNLIVIALIVGTKFSGFVFGGLLFLALYYLVFKNREKLKKQVSEKRDLYSALIMLIVTLVSTIVIALPNYIIAQIEYGSFLYQPPGVSEQMSIGPETFIVNMEHFGKWFYDFPSTEVYFSETVGHPGYFFQFALPFLAIISLFFLRKLDTKMLLSIFVVFGFVFIFLFAHKPDPWDYRLMFIGPLAVMFATTSYLFQLRAKEFRVGILVILVILCAFTFLSLRHRYLPELRIGVEHLVEGKGFYYSGRRVPWYPTAGLIQERFDNSDPENILLMSNQNDAWIYHVFGERWQNSVTQTREYDLPKYLEQSETEFDYIFVNVAAIRSRENRDEKLIPPKNAKLLLEDSYSLVYEVDGQDDR